MASSYPHTSYTMQNITVPNIQGQTICILGQSNVATEGLYTGLENYSLDQLNTTFGANQHITKLLRTVQYANNQQINKVSLFAYSKHDDASATASHIELTLTGTSTVTGSFSIKIDSNSPANAVQAFFSVSIGDTATAIATKIATAINAIAISPVSASATSGVVTFTSIQKGLFTAGIFDNIIPSSISGISYSFDSLTSGATDADFSDISSQVQIQNTQVNFFVCPYSNIAAQTSLSSFLYGRSESLSNNKDYNGLLVVGHNINYSNPTATTTSVAGKNIISVADKILSVNSYTKSSYVFASADEKAAGWAFINAIRLLADANIANYMQNITTGRPGNASIPIANTIYDGFATSEFPSYAPSATEISAMEALQYSIFNYDGTNIILGNAYTLSNDVYYKKYEKRQQWYIMRNFNANRHIDYFKQKNWVNGLAIEVYQVNLDKYLAFAGNGYDILSGRDTTDAIYQKYYAGLADNSDSTRDTYLDVLEKTTNYTVDKNTGNGIFSSSHRYTATAQIDNLILTQQNNLI